MTMLRIAALAAVFACSTASATATQQTVINFNGLEQSGFGLTPLNSYSESGYNFNNDVWYGLSSAHNANSLYAGSAGLAAVNLSTTTLTRADGAAFSLDKISLADYASLPGSYDVTFIGTKVGGATVSQTFSLSGSNSFSNYTFSNFTNLISASWQEGLFRTYQVDNIAASVSAVPEPGTYATLLAGLGLLGFMRRRKNTA